LDKAIQPTGEWSVLIISSKTIRNKQSAYLSKQKIISS
jgi:hypothetical protein